MKKFIKDFFEFAKRGNVLNLAVGVIIGAAFQGVIGSLVDNILSPLLGLVTKQNFDSLEIGFGGITLGYGRFITAVINFIIMAFVVFILSRIVTKLFVKETAKEEKSERHCNYCYSVIDEKAVRCPFCTSKLEGYDTDS